MEKKHFSEMPALSKKTLHNVDLGVLVAHINDAIIVSDLTFTITYWGGAAELIYGWAAEEALGQKSGEIIPVLEYLNGSNRQAVLEQVTTQGQWSGTVVQPHRSGRMVYVDSSIRLLRDDTGKAQGMVVVNRDVSERMRAEQEQAAMRRRRRLLSDATEILVQVELDVEVTLNTVAQKVGAVLGDSVMMALVDEQQVVAPTVIWHDKPEARELLRVMMEQEPIQVGAYGLGAVLATGGSVRLEHVDWPRMRRRLLPAYRSYFEQIGVASLMIVPLKVHERIIGAIQVSRDREGQPYSADDLQLLQDLAARAALAIDRAQLYHAERAARAFVERAMQRMVALQQITAALAETSTLEEVFSVMLDLGLPVIGASRGGVGLLNESGDALLVAQFRGYDASLLDRWPEIPLNLPTPLTDALRRREPVYIRSLEEKLARYPFMASIPSNADNPVQAALPLIVDGQGLGVLLFVFESSREFPDTDRVFIEALGQQCAQALKRAQLGERERLAHRAKEQVLAQLSILLAAAPIGICFWDATGTCLQLNDTFAALNGQSIQAQRGLPVEKMAPPALARLAEDVRAVLATGTPRIDREVSGSTPASADLRHWEMSVYAVRSREAEIIGVGAVVVESTSRKRLEAQLLQSQKMESVGRLAGGIAHDFNNLLTVIQGCVNLAQTSLEDDSPVADDLLEIQRAAERAASLTQQLLAFARKRIMSPRVISLNRLILSVDTLLRRLIGEDIELETRPEALHDAVRADLNQIEQVLINLAVNARDAMPQGGQLTVETQLVGAIGSQQPSGDGRFVLLAVSDTGAGMDDETREHAFEPFFTTKEVGRGTGLGLATCYGIVQQHGGTISIYSELGRGTTVKIYLPLVDAPAERDAAGDAANLLPLGTETILIVEDDESVRNLAARVLRALGYRVLEAANGEAAASVARAYLPAQIDMLLTDVVMPGQVGTQVAANVAQIYPGIRVLYTSGYTENVIVHHNELDAGVAFLAKPFMPAALAQAVRQVLDGRDVIEE